MLLIDAVIRPRLPLDILQANVGEAEDMLLSILGAIQQCEHQSVLVILDDVEHIFGDESQTTDDRASRQTLRLRSSLLLILDRVRTTNWSNVNILMVLTTSRDFGSTFVRFDRTFYLGPPDEEARRSLLASIFCLHETKLPNSTTRNEETELLLSDLVESTVGRSYAEIVQYCRQSIESTDESAARSCPSRDFYRRALESLKERLQTITPESLRGGVIDDYVDMRVLTARDLLSSAEPGPTIGSGYVLPLRGASVANAWKALEYTIITPLCRSKELQKLLGTSTVADHKTVTGGILLTGEPGSGKTQIAMHCARYAAQLLPSVKLIDVSCTSMVHKEVGGSEEAVHRLFEAARKAAPCIILMDGIENIAAVRGNDATTEGTMDRVLSTVLVEMDGVADTGQSGGVAVIGITHDARWIDPALKRPGRLSPVVQLSLDWDF